MNTAARLTLALTLIFAAGYAAAEDEFTQDFPLDSCLFLGVGGNPYFPLIPGRQTYFTNSACVAAGECDELTELWITTQRQIRRIPFAAGNGYRKAFTRVIEERESEDGELVEVSRNYVADCWPSHDVYYFGEQVDIYEDGAVVDHEGAWLAGQDGALPGILMPQDGFMVGSRYYQEIAPGVALDRAEHIAAGFSMQVPAGRFDDCVEVEETTPLEPGAESGKVYCRGIGLVKDDELELAAIYGDRR